VAGLVLVGAEPARSLTPLRDLSPTERAAAVDGPFTRDWFRTVTRATWDANMWRPEVYSRDTAAAAARWREVADVPLPTMIRYLSEFLAGDDRETLASVHTPMLVIRPGFTPRFRADTANRNAVRLMRDSWEPALLARPNVEDHVVGDAHFFVMFDRPDEFHGLLDGFVARIVSGPARQR
jgi:pimeloyl-ACP methyl ester carboxylesterase